MRIMSEKQSKANGQNEHSIKLCPFDQFTGNCALLENVFSEKANGHKVDYK